MAGYLRVINSKVFVLKSLLVDSGADSLIVDSNLLKNKNGKFNYYSFFIDKYSKNKWIYYDSLPENFLHKLNLPLSSHEIKIILENSNPVKQSKAFLKLEQKFNEVWTNPSYWNRYLPLYMNYFFEVDLIYNYAKTHAIFDFIINLKKKKTKSITLFEVYCRLPKVIFKTNNFNLFKEKLKKYRTIGIDELLVQDCRINNRSHYKVIEIVKKTAENYSENSVKSSKINLHTNIIEELSSENLPRISKREVNRIYKNIALRNRSENFIGDKLNYYRGLLQDSGRIVKNIGDLYYTSCSPICIHNKEDSNGHESLIICTIIDVFSRKIVGFSINPLSSFDLIIDAIKDSVEKNRIIPKQIFIENNIDYKSFRNKGQLSKMTEYGIEITNNRNTIYEAIAECWIKEFEIVFLNEVITNFNRELDLKKINKDNFQYSSLELENLITKKIISYNCSLINLKNTPKNIYLKHKKNLRKANKYDILYLFGKKRFRTITSSKLYLKVLGRKYSYTLWNKRKPTKNNLLNKKINIHYDEFDMSYIHLFDDRNHFLFTLEKDKTRSIIPYTENEIKKYQNHAIRINKALRFNLNEIYEEMKNENKNLKPIPLYNYDNKIFEKQNLFETYFKDEFDRGIKNMKEMEKVKHNSAYDGVLKEFNFRERKNKKFTLKLVR